MAQKAGQVLHEIINSGWTYIWIGLWFTIGGSRTADGFEAVLGVIMVLGGALQLDRKAKKALYELEKSRKSIQESADKRRKADS